MFWCFFLNLFLFNSSLLGQEIFSGASYNLPSSDQQVLDSQLDNYTVVSFDSGQVREYLRKKNGNAMINFKLAGVYDLTVLVQPRELYSGDCVIRAETSEGVVLLPCGPSPIFEGTIEGVENSEVYIFTNSSKFYLSISQGTTQINLSNLSNYIPSYLGQNLFVISENLIETNFTNVTDCSKASRETGPPDHVLGIALDADFEFFNQNKGASGNLEEELEAVKTVMEDNLAESEKILRNYFKLGYQCAHIHIWAVDDPYVSSGSDANSFLEDIKAFWDNELPCYKRVWTHLLSGKNLGYDGANHGLSEMCLSQQWNYSVSRHSGQLYQFSTIAHEIIHGFGIAHSTGECQDVWTNEPIFPLMWEGGSNSTSSDGNDSDYFIIKEVKGLVNSYLDATGSCLNEFNPTPQGCETCHVVSDLSVDNDTPILNCNNNDLIEYTLKICNDCNARNFEKVQIRFNGGPVETINLTGLPNQLGDFTNVKYDELPPFWRFNVFKENVYFNPSECKEFKIKVRAISNENIFTTGTSQYFNFNLSNIFISSTSQLTIPSLDFNLATGTTLSSLNLPPDNCTNEVPQRIEVNGTFTIDQDYCFVNSEFIMRPGSEIIVNPNVRLTLKNCELFGCDQMWKGIRVSENGGLVSDGSTITDAEYAIIANTNSSTGLKSTRFENNYISYYVPPSLNGQPRSLGKYRFDGCSFIGGPLLNAYQGQSNHGEWSHTGILANDLTKLNIFGLGNSPINIAQMPVSFNSFTANGIKTKNSNLFVSKSVFENIPPVFGFQPTKGGTAIAADGDGSQLLKVENLGYDDVLGTNLGGIGIKNGYEGISFTEMNAEIEGIHMQNLITGISATRGMNTIMNIVDNNIEARRFGIRTVHNVPIEGNIMENTITIKGERGEGIRLNEIDHVASNWIIHNNLINIIEGVAGISHNSGNGSTITNNTINMSMQNVKPYDGIILTGSPNVNMECNVVIGNGLETVNLRGIGISLIGSSSSMVSCNTIDNTTVGMSFWGVCANNEFQGNTFNNHQEGLLFGRYLADGTSSGAVTFEPQTHKGNIWNSLFEGNNGNPDFRGAVHLALDPTIPNLSKFVVDPMFDGGNTQELLPSFSSVSSNWFSSEGDNNLNTFICNNLICPVGIGFNGLLDNTGSDKVKDRIVDGSLIFDHYQDALFWTSSRHLYKKIVEDSGTLNGKADLIEYYNNKYNSSIGAFSRVSEDTYHMMTIDATFNNQLENTLNNLSNNLSQLVSIQETLYEGGLSSSDEQNLINSINMKNEKIESIVSTRINTIGKLKSKINVQASKINTDNSSITTDKIFETQELMINDIILRSYVSSDFWSTGDKGKLYRIANQCALSGGDGVFRARTLLSLIDPLITFDDTELCSAKSERNSKARVREGGDIEEGLSTSEVNLLVYPSPAKDRVWIEYQLPKEESGVIRIFNSIGEEVYNYRVAKNSDNHVINANQYPSGIYWISLMQNGRVLSKEELIISK